MKFAYWKDKEVKGDVARSGEGNGEKTLKHRGDEKREREAENIDKDRHSVSDRQPKSVSPCIQIGIRLLLSSVDGSRHIEVIL